MVFSHETGMNDLRTSVQCVLFLAELGKNSSGEKFSAMGKFETVAGELCRERNCSKGVDKFSDEIYHNVCASEFEVRRFLETQQVVLFLHPRPGDRLFSCCHPTCVCGNANENQ